MIEAGLPLTVIRRVFITHHHSDHNVDLGPMLSSAWANGLATTVDVYGPAGLLNHFVPYNVAPEKWTEAARTTFAGNIVVGKDMLELPI